MAMGKMTRVYKAPRYKRKRKRKSRPQMLINRTSEVMPPIYQTTLRYATHTALDPGVNSISYFDFRANGLFDPESPIGGGQPLGFDQLTGTTSTTGFYNHYKVIGARIKATFMSYLVGSGDNYCVGVEVTSDENYPDTTLNGVLENGNRKYSYLTKQGGSRDVVTVTKTFSPRKFFGVKDIEDIAFQGSRTSLPTEEAFFHVWCGAINPGDNPGAVNVMVEVQYVVQFYDQKDLPRS